jgi:hypothetical protein
MYGAAIATAIVAGFANLAHPPLVPPPPPPPPPPTPVDVDFAHTPAQARTDLLDYKHSAAGGKIFTKATTKLDTSFLTTMPNVTILLAEILVRSQSSSWGALLAMTIGGVALQFHEHYVRVTLAKLKTHVNTFIDADGHLAQNDYQLYLCLSVLVDSTTKEAMNNARNLCWCSKQR